MLSLTQRRAKIPNPMFLPVPDIACFSEKHRNPDFVGEPLQHLQAWEQWKTRSDDNPAREAEARVPLRFACLQRSISTDLCCAAQM